MGALPHGALNFATEYFLLVFLVVVGRGKFLSEPNPEKSLLYNTEVAYFIELIDRYFK